MLFSCGEKAEKKGKDDKIKESAKDINILEMNDACELVDACIIVIDEMTELFDKYDMDDENMPPAVIERFKMLEHQYIEIKRKSIQEGWTNEKDVEHCRDLENFREKLNNLFPNIQGEKGVMFYTLGDGLDTETTYGQGMNFYLPWNEMIVYDVKTQPK